MIKKCSSITNFLNNNIKEFIFFILVNSSIISLLFNVNILSSFTFNSVSFLIYSVIYKNEIDWKNSSLNLIAIPFVYSILLNHNIYKNYSYILPGFMLCGVGLCVISYIIKYAGLKWINNIFPPLIMGMLSLIIGFNLSQIAIEKFVFLYKNKFLIYSLILISNLTFNLVFTLYLKRSIYLSILYSSILSYIQLYLLGKKIITITTTNINNIYQFSSIIPYLYLPKFDFSIIISMMPIILFILIENINSFFLNTAGENRKFFYENKINHLTQKIFNNGLSLFLLSTFGSYPNSFYFNKIKKK